MQLRRLEPSPTWLAMFEAMGGEAVQVGPFLALLDGTDSGGSYAAPLEGVAGEIRGALQDLRTLFRSRGAALNVEFNDPLFPALEGALQAEGLRVTEREPILICTPARFTPAQAPEVQVRFLQPGDDDGALAAYQRIFFQYLVGAPWPEGKEAMQRIREQVVRGEGQRHALAFLDGEPVGTGFVSSENGVAEITRIATIPGARRRGVASTLTSFMVRDRFERTRDTLAWLTASGVPAQMAYRKIGFSVVGNRVCMTDPV